MGNQSAKGVTQQQIQDSGVSKQNAQPISAVKLQSSGQSVSQSETSLKLQETLQALGLGGPSVLATGQSSLKTQPIPQAVVKIPGLSQPLALPGPKVHSQVQQSTTGGVTRPTDQIHLRLEQLPHLSGLSLLNPVTVVGKADTIAGQSQLGPSTGAKIIQQPTTGAILQVPMQVSSQSQSSVPSSLSLASTGQSGSVLPSPGYKIVLEVTRRASGGSDVIQTGTPGTETGSVESRDPERPLEGVMVELDAEDAVVASEDVIDYVARQQQQQEESDAAASEIMTQIAQASTVTSSEAEDTAPQDTVYTLQPL